ncbi:MAG: [Fe-S]-binding protein, partial [Pirellulales bacterium]
RINCITGGHPTGGMMPMVFDADREAIEAALSTVGLVEPQNSRVMQITNTLHVGEVLVSAAYKGQLTERSDLTVVSGPTPMVFDAAGNLADV